MASSQPPAKGSPPSTESQQPASASSAAASTSPAAEAYLQNDPARTGFDPKLGKWANYFGILTGRVTPEGRHHYREWRYRENEARDCARCEKNRDYLLRYSPIVRFLSDKIADLNGNLDADNIMCRRCPTSVRADGTVVRRSAGFDPNYGILLCANEIGNRKHLEDSLAHEMVHAWDHLRWKVDFAGDKNLRHAACTEVRAPPLSPLFLAGRGTEILMGRCDRYAPPCSAASAAGAARPSRAATGPSRSSSNGA